MSLVGAIVSLLSLAVLLAVVFWAVSAKVTPLDHRDVWTDVTDELRERHHVYPTLAFVGGWVLLMAIMWGAGQLWTFLALAFAVPYLLTQEHDRSIIHETVGLLKSLQGGEVFPTPENFALPLDVYESRAEDVSRWSDAMHVPRRTLLTLGASGAGKSETLKHFVDQLQNNPDEPVVVFDMKRDYQEFLEERGIPTIRLSSEGSSTEDGAPIRWNVFEEIETGADADEVARGLFSPGSSGSGSDNAEFFENAAVQLFAANLKYLRREMENPTNADIKRYYEGADAEKMFENLTRDGHEDLAAVASQIDPSGGRMAASVFATAQQQVSSALVGDFVDEGDFSIREYMQNPQGRVLVLDYPNRQAETIAPIFRFLIDEAIKHGMDDSRRQAYYLLDEIEHMNARIKRLGSLINVGRGVNCQLLLSLQSVAQLQATYGKERASALLSGMNTSIILRVADEPSVDFARATVGTHFEEYTAHTEHGEDMMGRRVITERETRRSEEHDFAEGDFYQFEPGEAVIARQGKGWVFGRIHMLPEPEEPPLRH